MVTSNYPCLSVDNHEFLVSLLITKMLIDKINYFSESGIWLGKILANGIYFAKSSQGFPCQNFVLYSTIKDFQSTQIRFY